MLPKLPSLNSENYINRELSAIEFNRRVLGLARDKDIPLLERIRYVSIVGSNLDEFYMVRVSSYIKKIRMEIDTARPDGFTPEQLVHTIRERVLGLLDELRSITRGLLEQLAQAGVYVKHAVDLSEDDRTLLREYFAQEIYPILTPLAADSARPFPFISNLSMNIAIFLAYPNEPDDPDLYEFVRIKIPETLPRFVDINLVRRKFKDNTAAVGIEYVRIEDVISDNLDLLFPGMRVVEHHPFRVTRNADIDYEHEKEDEGFDFSELIENSLRERRFGAVVRLTVQDTISHAMLQRLTEELEVVPDRDVYIVDGALGTASLVELAAVDRPDLKYPKYTPRIPEPFQLGQDMFTTIRQGDVLIHLPYDSFAPVEEFFKAAAHDPDVVAIKATLYRIGRDSPLIQSLIEARENDKQVTVLVELKARFDEENNLEWARQLEEKGVHVTYGVEKLAIKTHGKICLVIRKEGDSLRRYVHLATGNYNSSTARFYSDIGLFTCNPEIADDATRLFNRLTGFAPATQYKRLLIAPEYLLPSILQLIDNEASAALQGRPARIIMKMNQLEEDRIIQHLYRASQCGVQIDLIVRGLCCLAPGLAGMSENIRVIGITGRYLEHSRVYYFQNAPADRRIYIGSADLMRRNLYNRVEIVSPVIDPRLQRRLLRILYTDLRNTAGAWLLDPSGTYHPILPPPEREPDDSQTDFMRDSFGLDLPV
ncbi:MAG: polyphosphate kinase 1 [Anaerolineae bacterium]|nr:MAG: polyphosphate kinase [Chloroflexi bacterium OLB13]MBW7880149.1 polyphosphate kinase 1 [Anaerolineae bacterium]